MTDVVVLAAGLGRRLAGAAVGPKWLAPVNGRCPASVQLAAFERAGVEHIHVVVPDEHTEIERFLLPWRERLQLELVANPRGEELNNWYSLLLGLQACVGHGEHDVVVANSDLFAAEVWLAAVVDSLRGCESTGAVAVDPARGRTEEAMKVALDAAGTQLSAIGKRGIAAPAGEYVGMAWWSPAGAAELRSILQGFVEDPGHAQDWYEHGIQQHLDAGGRYAAVAVPSSEWVEIDDPEDLRAARRLPLAAARP